MNFDNVGKKFLKKDMLKDGLLVKIVSPEPQIIESTRFKNKNTGKPAVQYVWTVLFSKEEWMLPINFTSIKEIKTAYGSESKDWVGKILVCKLEFDRKTAKHNTYWLPAQTPATAKDPEIKTPDDVKWEE